ncbi:MAG: hypothetical protein HN726_01650 [Candidatus Magasanikbacteria bacterium]|jgi:hypothetical protein|nr:hypothetical protein [Candidatus Magasanikbacteria bacterium]
MKQLYEMISIFIRNNFFGKRTSFFTFFLFVLCIGIFFSIPTYAQGDVVCEEGTRYFHNSEANISFCLPPCKAGFHWVSTATGDYQKCVPGQVDDEIVIIETSVEDNVAASVDILSRLVRQDSANISLVAKQFIDDPEVERVTQEVVLPVVAVVSFVSLLPSLWQTIPPLFRFLFLQPILLFRRKKKYAWGIVYHSLTKLPLDLTTVRLVDAKTNHVIQTRVTDNKGRYFFLAEPGEYALEVVKSGYVFPSLLLKRVRSDGRKTDIYHGGHINVSGRHGAISVHIPLDPLRIEHRPFRILVTRYFRLFQYVISLFGLVSTLVSFFIVPTWYNGLLLFGHACIFLLFIVYIKPRRPKGWGVVSDATNNKSLHRVVVRLFLKKFHKLVATEITNHKGQYAFLVGQSEYYVTCEKKNYKLRTIEGISITDSTKAAVAEDIELDRI